MKRFQINWDQMSATKKIGLISAVLGIFLFPLTIYQCFYTPKDFSTTVNTQNYGTQYNHCKFEAPSTPVLIDKINHLQSQLNTPQTDPLSMIADIYGISEVDLRTRIREYAETLANDPSKKLAFIQALRASEQFEKATREAETLLILIREKKGKLHTAEQDLEHTEVEALSAYGLSLLQLGKTHAALLQLEQASRLINDESDQKLWVSTQKTLAMAYCSAGQADKAIPLYVDAMKKEDASQKEQYLYEDTYNLGHLALSIGDYDHAEQLFSRAFNVAKDRYSRTDVRLAITLLSLSQLAVEQKKFPKAEDIGRKYLGLLKETGKIDTSIAGAGFYNLAKILRLSDKPKEALEFYNRALDIYKTKLGEEHSQVAMTYNDIGLCKMATLQFNEAIKNFENAISMAQAHQYDNVLLSFYIANRGRALMAIGQPHDARNCFEQALTLRQNSLNTENPLISDMYELIAQANEHEQQGKAVERINQAKGAADGF